MNILLISFLAFFAPTLAFISVNRTSVTTRQMVQSSLLCACLSALLALGLIAIWPVDMHHLLPMAACGCALVIFLLLSERMFTKLIRKKSKRLLVIFGIFLVGLALSWVSPWILLLALLFHVGFSAYDLHRNWYQEPIYGQFPFAYFECGSGYKATTFQATAEETFKSKPNIYFLYLESFHSPEALRDLYGCEDDFGLREYLAQNGFERPSAISSNTNTVGSLFSIVHMMTRTNFLAKDLHAPESFRILKKNGYRIAAIDASMYVFNDYLPWLDSINFDLPWHVKMLYDRFMPFFMQSRFARAVIGGTDPYMTALPFARLFKDFQTLLRTRNATPQCVFFRFGADHTPWISVTFEQLQAQAAQWEKRYIAMYKKVVEEIRQTVDLILQEDPDACIILAGDHGATKFRNSWEGLGDINYNMRSRNLEPAFVARDVVEVLVAARYPKAKGTILQIPVSHGNLLRDMFLALGLSQNGISPRVEQTTWMGGFLIARGGQYLTDWESYPADLLAESMSRCIMNAPDRPENHLCLARYCHESGSHDSAAMICEKVWRRFQNSVVARDAWLAELLLQGRTVDAEGLVSQTADFPQTSGFRQNMIWMHTLTGNRAGAQAWRNKLAVCLGLSTRQKKILDLRIALVNGDMEAAIRLVHKVRFGRAKEDITFLVLCAFLAIERRETALAQKFMDNIAKWHGNIMQLPILRAFCNHEPFDWKEQESNIRAAMAMEMGFTIPILSLWLAGMLEQQGQIREAAKILLAQTQETPVPELVGLTGLFCMRHKLNSGSRETDISLKQHAFETLNRGMEIFRQYPELFDENYYRQKYTQLIPKGMEPMRHFLEYGLMLSLNPNPIFNTQWNLLNFPRCCIVCEMPLAEYMRTAIQSEILPNPTFWPQAWIARHPDYPRDVNPLIHCLRQNKGIA